MIYEVVNGSIIFIIGLIIKLKTERVHIKRKTIKIKNENKKEKKLTKCTLFFKRGKEKCKSVCLYER